MKLIYSLGIGLILLVSCDSYDDKYIKSKIYDELNYSLTNFSVNSINASGIQFGSDFDEQFVLKLDSSTFIDIVKRIDRTKSIQHIGDSLIQYDRVVNEMEYISIQLNRSQQTLTYSHWSD